MMEMSGRQIHWTLQLLEFESYLNYCKRIQIIQRIIEVLHFCFIFVGNYQLSIYFVSGPECQEYNYQKLKMRTYSTKKKGLFRSPETEFNCTDFRHSVVRSGISSRKMCP